MRNSCWNGVPSLHARAIPASTRARSPGWTIATKVCMPGAPGAGSSPKSRYISADQRISRRAGHHCQLPVLLMRWPSAREASLSCRPRRLARALPRLPLRSE
ncbi:hypothetical protein OR16_16077 [Cupriavidus basilensis OR16]|uniref:Uncharacterized protein n=1 Tax=Cupriavidus basilensis OR16 TaxID=1127483 RepID=H1S5S2_9BURK|nr:hypothetical protein OR16_16077 [Cupriavidus basilensis OR16]